MNEKILQLSKLIYSQNDIAPSHLEIPNRQLNYWIDKGIIPFVSKVYQNEEETRSDSTTMMKRVRLDLSQSVWVLIINQLYQLGQRPEQLWQFAYNVWQKPRLDKYADDVFKYHINKNPLKLNAEIIHDLKAKLSNEVLMNIDYRTVINPFTEIIKSAVLYRDDFPHALIYIPETGEHSFVYRSQEVLTDLMNAFNQHTFISIPLKPILTKALGADMKRKNKTLLYLNNVEQHIHQEIVSKKPKRVEIHFKNNKVEPVIIREEHKKPEELAKLFLNNSIKVGSKIVAEKRLQGTYKVTVASK